MSDYKVLAEAGESLAAVLWEGISADLDLVALIDNPSLISLESPADLQDSNQALLSVYLYRFAEDAYLRNQGFVAGTGGRARKPPLALDLNYVITPLLRTPRDQQIVLGKVLQILYDRPVLEGSGMTGSLAQASAPPKILLNSLLMDDAVRVWHAIGTRYKLSAFYTVRVTMLDSTFESFIQPVVERQTSFGSKRSALTAEV